MLEKRVHMTKQQFMEYLGMVVRDDNATALRRACQSGKRKLEASGLLPQRKVMSRAQRLADAMGAPTTSRQLEKIDEAEAPGSPVQGSASAKIPISKHGVSTFKAPPRALARLTMPNVSHLEI